MTAIGDKLTPQQHEALKRLIGSVSLDPVDAVPGRLYHYTNGVGLLGILKTGHIHATNFAYLNDSEEIRYGVELATEMIDELLARATDPISTPLRLVRDILRRVGIDIDYYIASFCTEVDRLSQWRGYGGAGSRYCVGFDTERFDLDPGTRLYRLIYDPTEQRALLNRALSEARQMVEAESNPSAHFLSRIAGALAARIIRQVLSFKHPDFKEECEWRLVREVVGSLETIEFDVTQQGFVRPYVELSLAQTTAGLGSLPITDVIVGSRFPTTEVVVRSTGVLLSRHGYTGVLTRSSNIPLRT